MDKDKSTTSTGLQWEQHTTYLNSKNYINFFNESVRFYEGDQWDKDNNMNIPKVVFNVIKMIIDSKAGNILSTPFSTHFRNGNENDTEKIEKYNNFDRYMWKEMNHDLLNRKLVNDGLIKGTFAIHYYWSEDTLGKKGIYQGSLQAEALNPLFVAVANPKEKDIQKQKWIIVATQMEVKKIRELCEDKEAAKEIISDEDLLELDKEVADIDADEATKTATLYTKYFRKNGEVYYQQSTKKVLITKKAKPLNPRIIEMMLSKEESIKENDEFRDGYDNDDLDIDSSLSTTQNTTIAKSVDEEDKFYLYPIEMGSLTPSDNSIYGLSDVSPIIMAQKMLNVYFATIYKKNLDDVFPKWIVKKGAIQQQITGMPNEQITDYSIGQGWGIQKVQGEVYSNSQMGLASTITDFAKMVSNSRDVIQGDSVGANMSAIAIQSLQTQAEKPIAQQRESFIYSLVKMAKIRSLYYKFYFEEKNFAYELDDIDYEKNLENNGYHPINKTQRGVFNGTDYLNTDFDISVDVGRGTKYDAITAQETVNNLFLNGTIDKMDSDKMELFINLIDDNLFPYKDKLRSLMRKLRQSEKAQLQQQVQELSLQIQELTNQNQQYQVYIKSLSDDFTTRLNVANENIKNSNSNYQQANNTIMQLYSLLNKSSNDTPKK